MHALSCFGNFVLLALLLTLVYAADDVMDLGALLEDALNHHKIGNIDQALLLYDQLFHTLIMIY